MRSARVVADAAAAGGNGVGNHGVVGLQTVAVEMAHVDVVVAAAFLVCWGESLVPAAAPSYCFHCCCCCCCWHHACLATLVLVGLARSFGRCRHWHAHLPSSLFSAPSGSSSLVGCWQKQKCRKFAQIFNEFSLRHLFLSLVGARFICLFVDPTTANNSEQERTNERTNERTEHAKQQ